MDFRTGKNTAKTRQFHSFKPWAAPVATHISPLWGLAGRGSYQSVSCQVSVKLIHPASYFGFQILSVPIEGGKGWFTNYELSNLLHNVLETLRGREGFISLTFSSCGLRFPAFPLSHIPPFHIYPFTHSLLVISLSVC